MNAQGHKWVMLQWSSGTFDEAVWKRDDGAYARYSNKVFDIIDSGHKDAYLFKGS
jgi:hypothetical protein